MKDLSFSIALAVGFFVIVTLVLAGISPDEMKRKELVNTMLMADLPDSVILGIVELPIMETDSGLQDSRVICLSYGGRLGVLVDLSNCKFDTLFDFTGKKK